MSHHRLQAVIFDMDGLIIDSEPFWKQAEFSVFSALGCEVTDKDQRLTARLTTQAVTEFWYDKSPWLHPPKHQAEQSVIDEVEIMLKNQCQAKPGFFEALGLCHDLDLKIGLASNAPLRLCHTVAQTLNCIDLFDCILSSENVQTQKPAPDIYLQAVKRLNVSPKFALALEDSISGAKAAKAAGLKVIGIPSNPDDHAAMLKLADATLNSLLELRPHHLNAKIQ